MKNKRSKLTGRISTRFTPEEIAAIDEQADDEGEHKPSTLIHRIVVLYLRAKGKL